MSARILPPVDSAVYEAALGPMLSAELKSMVSELARARREVEAMEKRVLSVVERCVARCVELHAPIEKLQATVSQHSKRRPVKLVRP